MAHVIFTCPFSIRVWRMVDLWDELHKAITDTTMTSKAIFQLLQNLTPKFTHQIRGGSSWEPMVAMAPPRFSINTILGMIIR